MLQTVLLVVHLIVAIGLVGVVLLQRSEGGALGMGGGGSGGFGVMSGRGAANLLTRVTAVLAALFMGISLALAILAGHRSEPQSIIDQVPAETPAPAEPSAPSVPLSE